MFKLYSIKITKRKKIKKRKKTREKKMEGIKQASKTQRKKTFDPWEHSVFCLKLGFTLC